MRLALNLSLIRTAYVGSSAAIPEEGIMSKHFKNVATKAFAVAFAGGLSLNGFALAVGASTRTAKTARAASMRRRLGRFPI